MEVIDSFKLVSQGKKISGETFWEKRFGIIKSDTNAMSVGKRRPERFR